jgi:uncharacterized protein (TIGR02757 family)
LKKDNREIIDFLEESYLKYNHKSFIANDPISIPHRFTKREDIEIAGFFAATIAWGNRKSIISNAEKLMLLMDNAPFDFILNHSKKDLKAFEKFVHRTFNGKDCIFFIESLKHIYKNKGGLEAVFRSDLSSRALPIVIGTRGINESKLNELQSSGKVVSRASTTDSEKALNLSLHHTPLSSRAQSREKSASNIKRITQSSREGTTKQSFIESENLNSSASQNIKHHIINFRKAFLETKHLPRTEKHISNPETNSSSKRLCMYLRWMVRQDKKGVDFGIWKSISPSELCLPLDVHTGNVSRALGLLKRTQNDWKAVEEITNVLKTLDANDPVKYDFALFGLGVDGVLKK